MEINENPGLKTNVISMYKSRFKTEGFFRPRIYKDLNISGKIMNHIVDIYFEFTQMSNTERTIIKTIEGKEVTDKDIWEFVYVLKDLYFFAKGIVYYDDSVSGSAKKAAETANIDLRKFDFFKEVQVSTLSALKVMLPNYNIIGDPFWIVMEITKSNYETTGNYSLIEGTIPLFLSKKQANNFCKKLKECRVFGVSQNHLRVLINLNEKGMYPEFNIVLPEFQQTQHNFLLTYNISCENLKKFYLRGDSNE